MSNRTHQCKRGPTHFNNWRSSGLFNVMHSNLNYYKTKQKMLKFNITTTITVLDLTSRLFILVEWRINAEFSVLYSNESLQTGINNNGIPLSLSLHLHRLLLMFLPSIPFFSSLQPLPVFFSLETLEPWKKKRKKLPLVLSVERSGNDQVFHGIVRQDHLQAVSSFRTP